MKNLFTRSVLVTLVSFTMVTQMNAQSGVPMNDSRCTPFNFASRGLFDENAISNLGTANPDNDTFKGTSIRATAESGETFGSAAGATGIQHTLWYAMNAPSCGASTVRFSTSTRLTNFNTRLTVFKRASLTDCSGTYRELASNDDDHLGPLGTSSTIILTQGSGLAGTGTFGAGDPLFIQISGNSGASGNFGLIVDVNSPNISITDVRSTEIDVAFPITEISYGSVSHIRLRYRKTGSTPTSYSEIVLAGTTRGTTITGLASGTNYDVWAVYECAAGDKWVSQKEYVTMTTPPSSSRLSSPVVTPVGGDCDNVNISWSLGSSDLSYTVFYQLAGSRTINSFFVSAPTISINTGPILLPAATYMFWIEILHTDGTTNTTPIAYHTTCGAMSKMAENTSESSDEPMKLNLYDPSDKVTNNISDPSFINTIKVYPNPATIEATLSYQLTSETEYMNIQIIDAQGREVMNNMINQPTQSGNYIIDLSSYEEGMYFVKVTANNFSQIKKLIVGKR